MQPDSMPSVFTALIPVGPSNGFVQVTANHGSGRFAWRECMHVQLRCSQAKLNRNLGSCKLSALLCLQVRSQDG